MNFVTREEFAAQSAVLLRTRALGILAASTQAPRGVLANHEFIGELPLSGELKPVHGVLPVAIHASKKRRCLLVPELCSPRGASRWVAGEKHRSKSPEFWHYSVSTDMTLSHDG